MNKAQLARLERHRKVKKTLTDYASAVASVPAFARLSTLFLQQLGLLDGTVQRNAVTSEGATLTKTSAGKALIARLVKAANALYLFYKEEANLEEAAKMHRMPSDYVNMTDLEVATEALDLSQRVTTHQAALADYNITPAEATSLAADAQSFDNLLPTPQLAIDAGKIKGATAKSTLSALNRFLKDDLRAGMELLKDSQPDAYKALREASQVNDAGYGKKGKEVEKSVNNEESRAGKDMLLS